MSGGSDQSPPLSGAGAFAQPPPPMPEEPPPLLGSWPRLYALVVLELALTVLALYALARWAA